MRAEVYFLRPGLDSRGARLGAETLDVYLWEGDLGLDGPALRTVLADTVVQEVVFDGSGPDRSPRPEWTWLVEISYRAGVTNPTAITTREAMEVARQAPLDEHVPVQTATLWLFSGPSDQESRRAIVSTLYNPLIQQAVVMTRDDWSRGQRLPDLYPRVSESSSPPVMTVPLRELSDEALVSLSKNRLLALTLDEMKAVQDYFLKHEVAQHRKQAGLPVEPTDVELEMIAQTWSEHCKHKIFAATIDFTDHETGERSTISSLYKTYVKQTTFDLEPSRPDLKSVFHDNSGVVEFDEDTLVCFKVETHNSPSALDPFGGAITGIVGVNRDIMGTGKGAKPIFNTNYLCFGDPSTPAEDIPPGLLSPRTVLRGVHHGIVEGGNHSGIPTVAGGFLFDETFLGKPLVFCGTGGVLPRQVRGEDSYLKHVDDGDLVVMLGGRIGKDGIHGATFSSLALDETSPTSAVQIGDPITQRKMLDFLLEARDLGLYKGITDNGAGGLSSSLGEMAESSGGVRIDLDRCPLKYQGLAPWEILVSESQERMSLAVSPETIDEFLRLARQREVEGTVIGRFTSDGWVDIRYDGKPVGALSLDFLHHGLPAMRLRAEWTAPRRDHDTDPQTDSWNALLLQVLADPTIASKEGLVRQYDHEVQARSVVKPFCGEAMDGPTEGAVLRLKPDSLRGLTVTHGVCPRYGDLDPYQMALNAVDEAYRAHIALGGDPDRASALDNFCWPDPVESPSTPDGPFKLAQLVKTCRGLRDACLAYGLPLISGKDSMKNDAVMNGRKVSIRPTLLVSLMGIHSDVSRALTTDFLRPGDRIVLLGTSHEALGGSSLEKVLGKPLAGVPTVQLDQARALYRTVHSGIFQGLFASLHDLSDGGLAIAAAESALGGRWGAHLRLPIDPLSDAQALFGESPSRFLASVAPDRWNDFTTLFSGQPWSELGEVTQAPRLVIERGGRSLVDLEMNQLVTAWNALEAVR